MLFSPLLQKLTQAFKCLPGIGIKSAQRMVLHLLERDRKGAIALAETILEAAARIGHCKKCRIFSETEYCSICQNTRRDQSLICVVESPADLQAIEYSGSFQGLYHVLMGRLSPIDGLGPEDLGLPALKERVLNRQGPEQNWIKEVIVATNPTVEGEATAYYINDMLKAREQDLKISRIAYGVPMGGELEYTDARTLAMALVARSNLKISAG
ncbi:MAG: recombination mediator RecR [Gammaproteobacteria bacterium]